MNKKQAMRLAKKLAEQEAAKQAAQETAGADAEKAEKKTVEPQIREEDGKECAIHDFAIKMSELEWAGDDKPGKYMVAHWPAVREELKEQMVDGQKLDFHEIRIRIPKGSLERERSLRMDFCNVMNACDMYYENAELYEEMIPLFRELLEIRDLSKDDLTRDNYLSAIGVAYHYLGRKDERDRYFEDLLAQGASDYVAGKYADVLLDGNELEKAEKLLANYKDSKEDMIKYKLEELQELKDAKK